MSCKGMNLAAMLQLLLLPLLGCASIRGSQTWWRQVHTRMHTHTQAHTDMCVRESLANAHTHTHTHTHIHASTPAEPVQASLLEPATHSLEVLEERRREARGGGGRGQKG